MMQTQSKHNHIIQINFRIVLYSTCKIAQTYLYFTSDWMRLWLQNLCWLKNKIMQNKSLKKAILQFLMHTQHLIQYIYSIYSERHMQMHLPAHIYTYSTLLLWRFLLTEGDPGCPGLGTPLEAADPVPECKCPALSRADNTEPGACCWDTFCSSAASCFGSTPGERWRSPTTHTHTTAIAQKQSLFNLLTNMNTFSTVRSVRRLEESCRKGSPNFQLN